MAAKQTSNLVDLTGLERQEVEQLVADAGELKFHGRQIFQWLWAKGVADFGGMTNLSRNLRASLPTAARISTPVVETRQTSSDGTTKFLLRLEDGRHIESVFIPDTPAQTFCISTQVGCAMKCA